MEYGTSARIADGLIKPTLRNSKTYSFIYNALGQRVTSHYSHFFSASSITPVSNGEVVEYTKSYSYDNFGRPISESITEERYGDGTASSKIVFLYDENSMVGFEYTSAYGTNIYYYLRNLQGDVIGIYDTNGNLKVKYNYDAWGNCTISSETNDYVLARVNPIRYRGYYYDQDTGLYYLNSRYYNPQWRRFISPDSTEYIDSENPNELNLYAYCYNDPVNYADPSGHSALLTLGIFALSSLAMWGVSELFGAQIAGGIGSLSGGATAISTGISLCAFGPWGLRQE